jgi:dipeptidyl aminopeptidase/acylaminoacyl peptidase
MRTIEERLRDAAAAQTADLTNETLRPLTLPNRSRLPRGGRGGRWAVPAFACVAVAAVVIVAVSLTQALRPAPAPPFTGAGGPPYFVAVDHDTGRAAVHDALTGKAIAAIGPTSRHYTAVAAARDRRTFFLATTTGKCAGQIYRLRLSADGSPTPETQVGGSLPMAADELATTPDGGRLALTSDTCNPNLLLVDTRTGTRKSFEAANLGNGPVTPSWSADGHTLVVVATNPDTGAGGGLADVLQVPASIADIGAHPILLQVSGDGTADYGVVAPDGRSVIVTVQGEKHGPDDAADYTLQRVPLTPSGRGSVIARMPYRGWEDLTADATGDHLLARVGENLVRVDNGKVRLLWKNTPWIDVAW